jgi:hypothetical protein
MHALDYLQNLPGLARAQISLNAQVTPSYVSRMLCSRARFNYAPLALVVECHKHSGGQIDVLGSLKPSGTDWAALREYLNRQDL